MISMIATDPTFDLLTRGGSVGILAFVVIGFIRGWIVPGREIDRVIAERDKALDLVYAQAEATSRALDAAERQVVK